MVVVGTGGKGTAITKTNYPYEEGLVVGTTKQTGVEMTLVPEEGSNVARRYQTGID